jgi:hypothetical protein
MAANFTRADLLSDISDKELTALTARLVNEGEPDPAAAAIGRARAVVARYTERYVLPEAQEKGYIRDLALYFIQPRLQAIPPKRQTAYDNTMRELRDIRDGKFRDLPQADPAPADLAPFDAPHGGQPKIDPSRF